jgi:phenylacetate-coenzyme A ligase PaaK-like adenylate-forming protein
MVASETSRALLINVLPDGVALDLPGVFCVATGGHAGPGVEILAQLGPRFDPIIVAGEPNTVLALLELGHARGLDLPDLPIRVITGGSFLLESTRTRFAALLGLDLDDPADALRAPLSSFGMSEVGMHLLWETAATVMVRRLLDRSGLGRVRSPHPIPCLMTYDPEHLHVEIVDGELVLSKLDPDALQPIIRYNSHDRCEPVDLAAVARLLALADPVGALQLPQPLIWIGMRDADPASLEPEVRR